jgi:hypothetical protein
VHARALRSGVGGDRGDECAWAPGDPQRRPTPADQALARAALLRRSDLRNWLTRPRVKPTVANRCRSFSPSLSSLVETGAAQSPEFVRGRLVVSSNVIVFATTNQAAAAWRQLATLKLLECVREKLASTPGIHVRSISNRLLAFPQVAPRSTAFRSSFRLSAFGDAKNSRGSFDVVLLGRGRALAVLAASADGDAFPAAIERRIASLIAKRLGGR